MLIPENIKESLDAYVKDKRPTGGFLYAVLTNDLFDAIGKADVFNIKALDSICKYIYNDIPTDCWGSKKKVEAWLNAKQE